VNTEINKSNFRPLRIKTINLHFAHPTVKRKLILEK